MKLDIPLSELALKRRKRKLAVRVPIDNKVDRPITEITFAIKDNDIGMIHNSP